MNRVGEIDPSSGSDEPESEDDEVYTECPRCGKNDDGDTIWKCNKCGCVHCTDCDPDSGRCPACKSGGCSQTGHIENE